MSKKETKKEEVQEIVEKPSAGSTAIVALMTMIIILLLAVIGLLVVANMQDNQNDDGVRETETESESMMEEDEVAEEEKVEDVVANDDSSVPDGYEEYTNEHYGFSLLYDEDFKLKLNDFEQPSDDDEIQYVKISDPDEYGVGYEFYLQIEESDLTPDEAAEIAMDCVEGGVTGEVISVRADGETVVGVQGAEFIIGESFCDDGEGFVIDHAERTRVSYFEHDGYLFRMIVPDVVKFNRIMDTFDLLTK